MTNFMKTYRKARTPFFALLYLIIVFSIVASCGDRIPQDAKVFKLEKSNFNEWEKLLSIENVIQLEENDSCLMAYAQKCLFTNDRIIFDDYKSKKIYSFLHDGKFICQIGRMGHSAAEYIKIKDICVSENDSILMVLDSRGIIFYNPYNGKYIKRLKSTEIDYRKYMKFISAGKDFLLFTNNENSNSIVLQNSLKREFGIRKGKRYHFGIEYFYRYDGECRVISDYGDFYIDSYKNGKLALLYRIDLGGQALPNDIQPKTFEEFMAVDNSPIFFKCITKAYETREWLWLKLVGPKQTYYTAFVNKQNGKYAFGEESMDIGIYIMGANEEFFYALIYPEFAEQGSLGRKILEKYNITKNSPVVVKLKLNENILR